MDRSVPAELMEPLCAAVGHIVVSWSFVEVQLEMMTAIIYQAAGGKHKEAEIPRQFDRKVRFLRKCFNQIPALGEYNEQVRGCIDQAVRIAKTRNFVVHGYPSHYDPDKQIFLFVKLDTDKAKLMHEERELRITLTQLLDEAIECQDMVPEMAALSHHLIKQFVSEDKRQGLIRNL